MSHQESFCNILNNNQQVERTSSIGSSLNPPIFRFQPYEEHVSEVAKRRLSDVSWSNSMEVSEEKRFKVNKDDQ